MIHTVTIRKFIKVSVHYSVHITHNSYVAEFQNYLFIYLLKHIYTG